MDVSAWRWISSGVLVVCLSACSPGEPEAEASTAPMNTPLGIEAQGAAIQDPVARRMAAEAAYADLVKQVDAMKSELTEATAAAQASMTAHYDRQMAAIDSHLAELCARIKADGGANRDLQRTYEEVQRQRGALALQWETMKEGSFAVWDETHVRIAEGLDAVSARIDELASQLAS